MNELINHKADCRTAPATRGLLKTKQNLAQETETVRVTPEKDVSQFECNICKIHFKQENTLTCHTKNIHFNPKCKVCTTTFQDEDDLIDHWEDINVYC